MLSSAVEGFSQSRWQEAAGFGIKVTLIEPTGYSTDWSRSSAKHATPLPVYDQIRDAARRHGHSASPRPATRGPPVTLS